MGTDQEIRRRFKVMDGDNLPHKTRNCSRDELAKFMGDMGFKVGAEIGVERGNYSAVLCRAIPKLKLKLVDPWDAWGGTSKNRSENNMKWAIRNTRRFNREFIRKSSLEAVKDIPDGSLDFVYIDQTHEFDAVMMDLIHWSPKVRHGGIVSGHDYSNTFYRYGVIPAVRAYTYAHNIYHWYVTNLDEHPSFFWVR